MEVCKFVHLKRNGGDGTSFTLTTDSTLILGRLDIDHNHPFNNFLTHFHCCCFVEIRSVTLGCKYPVSPINMLN